MHCRQIPNGFVCGSREPRRNCSVPGCSQKSSKQCDYPVAGKMSKTCDAYLCERCAVPQDGADRDFCRAHAKVAR